MKYLYIVLPVLTLAISVKAQQVGWQVPFTTGLGNNGNSATLPEGIITNNYVGDFILAPYSTIRSGLNGFSETNIWGNGSGIYNLAASNLASGIIPSARLTGVTVSNAMLVNATNIGTLSFGASAVSQITSNATGHLVLGNNHWWLDSSGHSHKASGRFLYLGGAGSLPSITDSGSTLVVAGNISASGWVASSNMVVTVTQPTTNGLGSQGGILGCNGTNWWTVMRDSGGVLTTNKFTLTTWP